VHHSREFFWEFETSISAFHAHENKIGKSYKTNQQTTAVLLGEKCSWVGEGTEGITRIIFANLS